MYWGDNWRAPISVSRSEKETQPRLSHGLLRAPTCAPPEGTFPLRTRQRPAQPRLPPCPVLSKAVGSEPHSGLTLAVPEARPPGCGAEP